MSTEFVCNDAKLFKFRVFLPPQMYSRKVRSFIFPIVASLTFSSITSLANVSVANPNALSTVQPYAVTISVPNLDEAANWYSERLGFREVQRKDYPELQTSLAFLELNGYRIELIENDNAQPNVARPAPPRHTAIYGMSQFSFLTRDLRAVRAELLQRNVPIISEFENSDLGVSTLFIRDLNGNLIQFIQLIQPSAN
ncbi:MAG TPA: hypothetical protein DCP31_08705 [Cyanobacteria bacterium UBA8543]|nr:hypothetical protein [Cyanobacteria bacterium UBA8543]